MSVWSGRIRKVLLEGRQGEDGCPAFVGKYNFGRLPARDVEGRFGPGWLWALSLLPWKERNNIR